MTKDPKAPRLSEELEALRHRFEGKDVSLNELIWALRGRAYMILLLLLALPFCTPIPLPGLSTPLGLAILLICLRLALGRRPWLPRRLRRRRIPAGFLGKVIDVTRRMVRILETFLRPRWDWFIATEVQRRSHWALACIAGAVLLLPLPIPLTNSFPAWVVILVAAGAMERDGFATALAYAVALAGLAYVFLLGGAAAELFEGLKAWIGL